MFLIIQQQRSIFPLSGINFMEIRQSFTLAVETKHNPLLSLNILPKIFKKIRSKNISKKINFDTKNNMDFVKKYIYEIFLLQKYDLRFVKKKEKK